MAILESIGLNGTIFIQFAIFFVTYIFVNGLVFKPYNKAYEERIKKTTGNKGLAELALEESKTLQVEYEQKAKILNQEFKTIYDSSKSEAMHEYDKLINQARSESQDFLSKNKKFISEEIDKAKKELGDEAKTVSSSIASKLLGKEIKA